MLNWSTPSASSSRSFATWSSTSPSTQKRSTISSGHELGVRVAGAAVVGVVVALARRGCSRSARPGCRRPRRSGARGRRRGCRPCRRTSGTARARGRGRRRGRPARRRRPRSRPDRGRPPRRPRARARRVHWRITGSASWRMKPSAARPVTRERLRPVAGHPDVELAVAHPRDPHLARRRRRSRRPSASSRMTWIAASVSASVVGLLPEHAPRRVAAADPADRAVAEHVVERREDRGGDGGVARRRVGDERADHDPLGRGEHLRVDDVRLLPEDVRVERPRVREAERLGALR